MTLLECKLFVLYTLVISREGRMMAKLEAILVTVKEAAESIVVLKLKDEQEMHLRGGDFLIKAQVHAEVTSRNYR